MELHIKSAPNQTYLNADFSYADFSGVDFSGSTFTNCNLNHVSFNGASLIGTVFSYDRSLGRHDLSINLDFDNANLSGATFLLMLIFIIKRCIKVPQVL